MGLVGPGVLPKEYEPSPAMVRAQFRLWAMQDVRPTWFYTLRSPAGGGEPRVVVPRSAPNCFRMMAVNFPEAVVRVLEERERHREFVREAGRLFGLKRGAILSHHWG